MGIFHYKQSETACFKAPESKSKTKASSETSVNKVFHNVLHKCCFNKCLLCLFLYKGVFSNCVS